jgi:hypothetical protein
VVHHEMLCMQCLCESLILYMADLRYAHFVTSGNCAQKHKIK